jgi:RHS repeat-associated protein
VGNLLALTDPKGTATAFAYDSLSRLKTRTSPLGKIETYQYDLNGNTVQYTDRRGQNSQFQYDALNRLVNEQYQDGSTVTRSFDPYGRQLTVNDSQGGIFAFGYDVNGHLLSQNEPNGTVQYTRDALGRVAGRQVAGQTPVAYLYDPAGNLLGSSSPVAGVTYAYDARSLPTALSRTNGITSSFSFDALGQLQSLVHAKGATALNTQSYAYDSTGSRISATNDLAQPLITQSAASTVDQADELISNGQTVYTHDLNGNRLTETSPSLALTYAWDGRNRLSSITDASGNVTTLKYDSWRNLTEIDKSVGGATTMQKFVFDILTNVVSLPDASGLPVSVLTGRSIDSHYASVDSSGNVAFGIGDALGSMDGVTNGSGTVTSKAGYDPYGQTNSTPPVAFPFAFTGRIPVTNNILYFRARFLDTATGRFISEDPLDFVGGDMNLYAYAEADPINFFDLEGTASLTTSMSGKTTTFDPRPEDPTGMPITIETRNKVVSTANPGANDPYSTPDIVGCIDISAKRYGNDAYINTGDPRGRAIHGGGSGLSDPFAPRQGWVPTFGCTRGQNEDIHRICRGIDTFMQSHPNTPIPYNRQ